MKFTATILLMSAIWTSNTLAAPHGDFVEHLKVRGNDNGALAGAQSISADTKYGYNWAGVIHTTPPATGTYTAASATFTVPKPTATDDSGNTQGASAWVGIDGGTYRNAILHAGVDFYVEDSTEKYDAWYEWYPSLSNDFNLSVTAGDVIVVKSGASDVALVNFGKVKFSGAQAGTSHGEKIGLNNATIFEIQQNGEVLTNVDILSDTEFDVTYESDQ
ncbi:hypothetical protein DTO164E3_7844 [Paecilomyces variotii]|nr:hypothetical protein DTO164E3_7844 [Paecilomyces variotii]KAJ9220826.1 hypothetical protein DTO169C6_6771 [Paecilomyces variotii]KAJ9376715.1 hypothetical protein DTO063F5_8617 [Paecilomyces variotii]KAJ9400979.1 hypothetical protein DTO282F9_2249 [Paecilomyces variotii]